MRVNTAGRSLSTSKASLFFASTLRPMACIDSTSAKYSKDCWPSLRREKSTCGSPAPGANDSDKWRSRLSTSLPANEIAGLA